MIFSFRDRKSSRSLIQLAEVAILAAQKVLILDCISLSCHRPILTARWTKVSFLKTYLIFYVGPWTDALKTRKTVSKFKADELWRFHELVTSIFWSHKPDQQRICLVIYYDKSLFIVVLMLHIIYMFRLFTLCNNKIVSYDIMKLSMLLVSRIFNSV